MKDNKFQKIISNSKMDTITMLVLLFVIAILRPLWAIPAALLVLVSLYLRFRNRNSSTKALSEYFDDLASEMDEGIAASVIYSPIPLCTINEAGRIVWSNHKFKEVLCDNSKLKNRNIYDLTGVKIHEMTNEDLKDRTIIVTSINRSFKLFITDAQVAQSGGVKKNVHSLRMIHWMENTAMETLKKSYRDERICIAHIGIDNLDDILSQTSDDKKLSLAGDIEKELRQWATKCQAALIRISKSQYIMLCDYRTLENNEANKFPILDEVREINTGVDIPASLSIGIGGTAKTIAQAEEFANAAMELSLGRGGDQVVVRKGSNVEYYGGKLQTVEKRNKGKSRIVALALRQLIDQAPRVFVMGHKLPDMDSLGAALGIARMAKNRGKETSIVIDTWDAVDMLYRRAEEEGEHKFIQSDYAKLILERNDLLVVVDNHKPSICECGELTTMVDKIVIIDHHRRGEEMIQNPTLVHIEPYASSTSELVTEMLQYVNTGKKGITNIEAEGLLSGITVDTKNFSVKTGVRTFEAATWLRRQGADTTIVRQFFQTDMNIFIDKAQIITCAKKLPGDMAISYAEGKKKNVSVLISMAADELLDIRGMRASFVVGEAEDGTLRVSARSLGDINVQRMMEKIGGGGNLTAAGAQLNMNIDDAMDMIENVVIQTMVEDEEKEAKKMANKSSQRETPKGA